MQENGFWQDQKKAQEIIVEANSLKSWTVGCEDISNRLNSLLSLCPELQESPDEDLLEEVSLELFRIENSLDELEVKKMLSGELDIKSCFLTINAGAGGVEACDWSEMLFRMYQKWAGKKGWKIEIIDILVGEVAGIKNVTMKFDGLYAYGYAKAEKGVHRLVRISPFDSNKRRHTSFASIEITPDIEDNIEVFIKPEDLRIDTFRSSGAGGQHVNTTDSGVRVTHLLEGISVSCQSQRSQVQNKETCMKLLRSKLYEIEVMKREKALQQLTGEKKEIAWGSQIRNYIFHPYTLVKDTRTKWEVGDIQRVMDGELDPFIHAYLKEFG